jgi:7-carboxy-7-deazaguanine synthase
LILNLPINEIFSSVQGEGSFTGTPAVFVRLQWCRVGCSFCDTKHTWEINDLNKISFDEMLTKTVDAPTWCDTNYQQLIDYLSEQTEDLIVITGGEPCYYDLTELTAGVIELGKIVQVETSGTSEIKTHEDTFITLSPKIGMPGGYEVLAGAAYLADEIKMPVGKMKDVEILKQFLQDMKIEQHPVYLQPLSQNEKATELCIEQARLNGWRLSAQLHKFLKVR